MRPPNFSLHLTFTLIHNGPILTNWNFIQNYLMMLWFTQVVSNALMRRVSSFGSEHGIVIWVMTMELYRQSPIFLSLTKHFLLVISCKHGNFSLLYLSGTYCHKTSTRPSSCGIPRQPTIYTIEGGQKDVSSLKFFLLLLKMNRKMRKSCNKISHIGKIFFQEQSGDAKIPKRQK